jgi:hypothetical protein
MASTAYQTWARLALNHAGALIRVFFVAQGHVFFAGTCGRFVSSAPTLMASPPQI